MGPKRGIPESRHAEALEGKRDNEAMRESYWKPAVERAGAKYHRSYQTRFLGAIEMMISAGESPMWVVQQMVHSDWRMIRQI
ncbi:MAG TPA: hypothetical protein VFS89_09830 [Nitrosospira sp.]|nr:hypothetical protein [Nitrosospira sp.]